MHPVPLRLTPESQGLLPGEDEPCRSPRKVTEPQQIPYEQLSGEGGSPKKATVTQDNSVTSASDIRPIQRPQPKKPAGVQMNGFSYLLKTVFCKDDMLVQCFHLIYWCH